MGNAPRHLVHGEWLTISEAARRLGLSVKTLYNYRYKHRRPDGGPGLLVDAWDWYSEDHVREHAPLGRPPLTYYVNGKLLTMKQAAVLVRVNHKAMRFYIHKHGCTVQTAVRFYRKRAEERAVREIAGIILGN